MEQFLKSMLVLHDITYGYHFVEIGLILWESIHLSKMLVSSEYWHTLFLYQIEKLNEVDKSLFRKLFNSHSKTALEFYYSESGSIPLSIKISMRRLNYWWQILSVEKSELINKIYSAQKLSPVSGDWIKLLENDQKQFDIDKMSDSEVQEISQIKIKNYIKKKAQEVTISYLVDLKKKHTKSEKLDVKDFSISEYLIDRRFSKEERELLFRLRSKTVDVKENFKNAYVNNNMLCELCAMFLCTQMHILPCPKLTISLVVDQNLRLSEKCVYGTLDQQLIFVKIYNQFWKLRGKIMNDNKTQKHRSEL